MDRLIDIVILMVKKNELINLTLNFLQRVFKDYFDFFVLNFL